eukprot:CAMPEP_0203842906 /NCGR_PEP_ID=MMETSP0359-20131031/2279_1 /ASSEMBLY_ACC=CAM_ASM_000338 /TAXON_ID=268821 /ORGANISM="Scrippsiella Hangoei, Strain SHTV-5" /LENGTH=35 /DNA_ID= /DNA_START= /DNA_END= /DNA_ORIENTATION=
MLGASSPLYRWAARRAPVPFATGEDPCACLRAFHV